jgi:uncharacterized protein (TIGR02246 family)
VERRKFLGAAVAAIPAATVAMADEPSKAKDEAPIRKLISQGEEAWNKHDAEALAAQQAEDVDHINTRGGWTKGREAIRKLWAQLFETSFKDDTSKMTIEEIRFLKPDVAVVILRIIHKRPAETESLATIVTTKDGDKWQIVTYQATHVQKEPK